MAAAAPKRETRNRVPQEKIEAPTEARGMVAALHDAVTGRRGFAFFLTLVMAVYWLLRVLYPDAPSNADMHEQLWMSADWRLGYGSGANPPLFTWLVKLVDTVLGSTIASIEVVRFALLWLFCFLSAHTVRGMTGDSRLAALAGLAPLAVFAVGWEVLFRHSNTILLIVSVAMTLAALQRLDRRDDWGGYLIFAAATAFGFYGKYNYALVWVGFLGAALMDGRLRPRLLNRRMAAALLLVLLLLSPLLYWVAGHLDGILGHGRLRLAPRQTYPGLPGRVSALVDLSVHSVGLMLPLFAFLVALCPRAFWRARDDGDAGRARWRRLLERYLLIVVALLVAAIFLLGLAGFEDRYIHVLLPVVPLAFVRLASAGFAGRRRHWLAAAQVGVVLLVMAGAAYRSATYAERHAAACPAALPAVARDSVGLTAS